jgi:type I restriction enzyme S subunit
MKAMHESSYVEIICNKSTIPHFTAEKVAEVRFTRPPVEEIELIVKHLTKECNAIDEASSRLFNKIEKLKEYRTALISAAVTGKIDVRGQA